MPLRWLGRPGVVFRRCQQIAGAHRTRHPRDSSVIAERAGGDQRQVVRKNVYIIDLYPPAVSKSRRSGK